METSLSISSIQDSFLAAISSVISSIINFIPQLLAAILVIVIGVYLSKWIKSLLISLLRAINLSAITKNSIIESFLNNADIRLKIEEVFGELIRWLILYLFFVTAINTLGLVTVGDFLTRILGYLPQVFAAILILAIGIIIAGFMESLVKSALAGFDLSTARLMGKISGYVTVIFAALIAISELGIAESYIQALVVGFIATLSISLGLAFGLGAKDLVSQILTRWYRDINQPKTRK